MLRLARQLRGFPQNEAAECLGVPNVELSRIETGLKEPSEDLLEKAKTNPSLIIFDLNFDAVQPLQLIKKLKQDDDFAFSTAAL